MTSTALYPLFNVIPMWDEARDEPPEAFAGRLEQLEMALTQTSGFHYRQIPEEIIGLSTLVKWTGEIRNGGVGQYYCNKITNSLDDRDYLYYFISEAIDIARRITDRTTLDLFIETLRLFALEADAMMSMSLQLNIYRSSNTEDLEKRISQATEKIHEDIHGLFFSLPNIVFVKTSFFDQFTETLDPKNRRYREYQEAQTRSFWRTFYPDGKFSSKVFEERRAAYDYRDDLNFILNQIEILTFNI